VGFFLDLVLALALAGDCKKCDDTGLVPCPTLAKHACLDASARSCSIAASCPTCGGTARVPCEKCGKDPGPANAAERARLAEWLAATRVAVDTPMGKALAHAASAHFLLTYDLPKIEVKGASALHPGMHLYLTRMEQQYARESADLGAAEADYLAPTHVLLWARVEDQEKASVLFTRQSSRTESKLMGRAPSISIFYDKGWLHDDSELHQAVVHQLAHCLLSNVWDGIWPGNIHGGWLDEGLAHAYELELFESVRHYCYIESDTILDIARGSWEVPVRVAVERGSAPGFLGVAGKNTIELAPEEQIFAWSYVDFVRKTYPERLGPLARAIKARKSIKDALQEALGISPFEFEGKWQIYVRTHYELKKGR